jgi:alpha-galactosidase
MMPSSLILVLLCLVPALCLDNGLGRTPPMGWNSWNHFACNINETIIRETADLLVKTGLAAKGYRYLNIDDCWQIDRNLITREIVPDATKFPAGMAALAEYVHQKGLLFGLYSDAGTKTCQGRPGGYGFEDVDAQTYAKWKYLLDNSGSIF